MRPEPEGNGKIGFPASAPVVPSVLRYVLVGWKSVSNDCATHSRKNTRTLSADANAASCKRTRATAKLKFWRFAGFSGVTEESPVSYPVWPGSPFSGSGPGVVNEGDEFMNPSML